MFLDRFLFESKRDFFSTQHPKTLFVTNKKESRLSSWNQHLLHPTIHSLLTLVNLHQMKKAYRYMKFVQYLVVQVPVLQLVEIVTNALMPKRVLRKPPPTQHPRLLQHPQSKRYFVLGNPIRLMIKKRLYNSSLISPAILPSYLLPVYEAKQSQ